MTPITRLLDGLSRLRARDSKPALTSMADAGKINDVIERALSAAGIDPHSGAAGNATATIRRSLQQAGLEAAQPEAPLRAVIIPTPEPATTPAPMTGKRSDSSPGPRSPSPSVPGTITRHAFNGAAGSRDYTLYVPATGLQGNAALRPLLVMLHGCTQSPDDFAAGTRMNALADQHGFLVAYPAQTGRDNGSRCWNWFRTEDQSAGRGEPSLIAGMVAEIASDHRVDPRRVFVAGLSAGAAMAVILGETYPGVFAAVGAHSGLPYGAAHDVVSAFSAMKGGRATRGAVQNAAGKGARRLHAAMPTIVFHGDADHTVDQSNGVDIVRDATAGDPSASSLQQKVTSGTVEGGRRFTRTVYLGTDAQPRAELWQVHGAGHAWSGGSASGSYTDPKGPDASAEMVRFFLQQPVQDPDTASHA